MSHDLQLAPVADGITLVDLGQTGVPGRFSAYFIAGERPAIIETGSAHDVPRWLEALEALNVPRDEVAYVVITHVHLDHGGGSGTLLAELPKARLVVHPAGAPFMIEPERLIQGSRAVFGEQLEELLGLPEAVDAARVETPGDGAVLDLGGGHRLRFIDAHGHARHQYIILDEGTGMLFSADELGVTYPGLTTAQGDYLLPSTAPNQFDPETMIESARRLKTLRPEGILFSHFGRGRMGVDALAARLEEQVRAFTALVAGEKEPIDWETVRERLYAHIRQDLEAQGIAWTDELRERFALDAMICARGLADYQARQLRGR